MENNRSAAKKFTTLLGNQLLQDATLESLPDVDKLRHAFQTGVESLPDGQLKGELAKNFDGYFRQLQRSLTNKKKNATRKKHKVEEDVRTSSLDGRPLLVSGQLEQRLVEIRTAQNFNEQCDQYVHLLLASSANAEWQTVILQNWAEHWNVDVVLSTEAAVKIVDCCTLLIAQEAKLEWLKLCVKIFMQFVEAVTPGDNGSIGDYARLKQLMWSCLYNNRPAAGTNVTAPVKDGVTCEDLLSALLSLYTEYLLLIEDKDHMIPMSGHVISLLYLLLGHSRLYYFDVVLQITVEKLPHHSLPVLLSLCRYAVDKTCDCFMKHHSYTKYLCCLITGHRISEQIQTSEFKVKKPLPAPKGYVSWLCNSSPSLAKELNLKRFTANTEVVAIVTQSTMKNIVEELLSVIDTIYIPEDRTTSATGAATNDASPLVENVQLSPSSSVASNDHLTDDENNQLAMDLDQNEVTIVEQTLDDDKSPNKHKEDNLLGEEEPVDGVDGTPANEIECKVSTRQLKRTHRKLSSRGKRKTSSLGFFVDTTPGHKNCVTPITVGIKKKRKSWRTPQRTRYYMPQ